MKLNLKSSTLILLPGCCTSAFATVIPKPVSSQHNFIEKKDQIIDRNNQLNPSIADTTGALVKTQKVTVVR